MTPTVTVTHGRWSKATVLASRLDREAFEDAVSNCFSLNHPNVVTMFGASHLDTPCVVVLESSASTSLREYLKCEEHKHEVWQKLFEAALGSSTYSSVRSCSSTYGATTSGSA